MTDRVTEPPVSASSRPWHVRTVEDVRDRFASPATGLSAADLEPRARRYGLNELAPSRAASPGRTLLAQFKNILVVMLLVATVLSGLLGHAVEAGVIVAIVLLAVGLGFVQEYRAERAIEALRRLAAPHAHVLRDGGEVSIAAREVLPGDLLVLRAGDRVPADARVSLAVNLACDESALTGESGAILKGREPLTEVGLSVADRSNLVYAGTLVTHGRGQAVVVATGTHTEFGRISGLVQSVESGRTPLQENLDRLGRVLGQAALTVVALIVAVGVARGLPLAEMFLFGIALAVAAVPEALPAVVTVSLALGVRRMVRRHVLVRRLPVVETLGSTSVICSDKTGTLTRNEMTVRVIQAGGQTFDMSGVGYAPEGRLERDGTPVEATEPVLDLLRAASLASDAVLRVDAGQWRVDGDPTEGALLVAARKSGLMAEDLVHDCPRVAEVPFTSERKRMTTVHVENGRVLAFSKGAADYLLADCAFQRTAQGEAPLDGAGRASLAELERTLAQQGLRVLAFARKVLPGPPVGSDLSVHEREMTFLGFVGIMDPPRPEAREAVEVCRKAGIRATMITGDHPLTAQAVAREIGLDRAEHVVSGRDLETLSDAELEARIHDIGVYARVSPADKLRVVSAWQRQGAVVAMTGDGVNDAPALKKADVGVAMGVTGTDVSREAAAMTLLDDNFASIVAAVEEGRIVFDNIRKYLTYLLSCNAGEILLMAGAVLAGLPLPLTAVQILYVNFATDGLPALALAVDPPETDLMTQPPRDSRAGIFTRPLVVLLLAGGTWSAAVNLALFVWALHTGRPVEEAMALTFVTLVLIQFFQAYNYRSDRRSALVRPFANRWLNAAVGGETLVLVLVVQVPLLHAAFGTFAFSGGDWALTVATALTVVPVLEAVKWARRRGWGEPPPRPA